MVGLVRFKTCADARANASKGPKAPINLERDAQVDRLMRAKGLEGGDEVAGKGQGTPLNLQPPNPSNP